MIGKHFYMFYDFSVQAKTVKNGDGKRNHKTNGDPYRNDNIE